MTIGGALPILLRLQKKERMLRTVLRCRGAEHLHAIDPEVYAETPDLHWSHCPLDLLSHPMVRSLRVLDRVASVAPLDGWPTRYASWAVAGIIALREA